MTWHIEWHTSDGSRKRSRPLRQAVAMAVFERVATAGKQVELYEHRPQTGKTYLHARTEWTIDTWDLPEPVTLPAQNWDGKSLGPVPWAEATPGYRLPIGRRAS